MIAQLEAAKKAAAKREAAEAATGTASIELTERYVARPADLLSCFTEAQRVMAFTQAPAQVRRLVHLALQTLPVLFPPSRSSSTAQGGLLGMMVIEEALYLALHVTGSVVSHACVLCSFVFKTRGLSDVIACHLSITT